MKQEDVYTIEEAAEKLKVTDRYIRDQISAGEIKAYKRGRRFYILHSDLIDYVKAGKVSTDQN